jgi:hypothetical protein
MKTIEPVQVWYNGQEVNATVLNAYATNVDLNVSANFTYDLFIVNEYNYINQVNSGMLLMDGQAYQDWDQDSFAWDWIASKLNLTITGEYIPYVPPAPPSPVIPTTTTTAAPSVDPEAEIPEAETP